MKNIIYTLSLITGLVFFQDTKAQDFLNINDFNFNETTFNSAYLATDSNKLDVSTIVSLGRTTENNTKYHFLVEGNIGKLGLGIGAKVNTSFFRIYQSTTAEILLAKKISFGKNHSLRFGLNSGIVLNTLSENKINEYTDLNDPVLTNGQFDRVGFTAGLGLNYNWNDKLNIGFSLPVLVNSLRGLEPVYFGNISYDIKISDKFFLKPSLMAYGPAYIGPTLYGDFKFSYKNYLWIKGGMNTNMTVTGGAGGSVKFVSFGYIYNHNLLNDFKEVYNSGHRIQVAFHFLQKKNKGI